MTQYAHEEIVNNSITDSNLSSNTDNSVVADAPETNVTEDSDVKPTTEQVFKYNYYKHDGIMSYSQQDVSTESISTFNEKFSTNRNLLNVEEASQYENNQSNMDTAELIDENNNLEGMPEDEKDQVLPEDTNVDSLPQTTENILTTDTHEKQVVPPEPSLSFSHREEEYENEEEEDDLSTLAMEHSYWETLLYLSITAFTALVFSLGYYYIENTRRDGQFIAKINNLEKKLLVASKEVMILDEGLKTTKNKLNSIEDESFGSNEMVASLKSELEASQNVKLELEDQIATLEKELEGATEAGLELERMLREFLSSQSDDNPLAQSVEDLQTRLNAQQATNETLTESLSLKTQENEALLADLATATEKCQQLDVEVTRITEELKFQTSSNNNLQKTFTEKIQQLDMQIKEISKEKAVLNKDLMAKKMEVKDLWEVVNQVKDKSFDFEKLCDVSHIKADAKLLLQERDELKSQLAELEGAHSLLEEHMKIVKEEIASVTRHCESAEKEKKEALTRLEVLTNFFEEKENQRYKEEAIWLQKEGEATSTVERIQTLQNEIQNYKQQIETLKKEIVDQEREYKNQISALETKAHEQWVHARQNERRLEESKAEASQLRNRLTLVEKNMNEVDPENKLHRLETNGETAASPQLYLGPETSSSPIMFTGSSGIPPPPPSYMFGPPLPPFLPPPPPPHSPGGAMFDISQRPPPLGGRLSSPPPPPLLHPTPSRYDNAGSPPPPLTPPLHNLYSHRSPPPMPFGNDRIPPPLPPLLPPLGTSHWGDETLPLPPRNSGFHPIRELRGSRNHKGSLHSSGDSLDKSHHSGKA